MSIIKITSFFLLSMVFLARGDVNTDAMKQYGMCFTPVGKGAVYVSDYKLGEKGEFIGNVHVSKGEMEFNSHESQIPSVTAGEGVLVTRVLGIESVMLEIHPVAEGDASFSILIASRHRVHIPAGSVVHIGMVLRHMRGFIAVWVQSGYVTVGGRTLTTADKAMFIIGTKILPNDGALPFMAAVRMESGAFAQSQLPGLTAIRLTELRELQRAGAMALVESAEGAGMPIYEKPFVPERPFSLDFSPSGTP